MPAGNMEGKELLAAFGLEQLPGTFKGAPDLASLSNDVTYTFNKGGIKTGSQIHMQYFLEHARRVQCKKAEEQLKTFKEAKKKMVWHCNPALHFKY